MASTTVLELQHDPAQSIQYVPGAVSSMYGDGGPVVLTEIQTPRVTAHELDTLELASHGKIVFTTDGDNKALLVRGIGVADPAVLDTTVLDAGDHKLRLSSDKAVEMMGTDVNITGDQSVHISVAAAPGAPTFHHYATADLMLVGTGTLAPDMSVVSGSFLKTDAESFELFQDDGRIVSAAGADSSIRYEALTSHEFFVGPDAAQQAAGSGAIEVRSDRVIIRKDVDLIGTIDSLADDTTTLVVEDQVISLAHTDDPATQHRDVLLSVGKTGLEIDTVPGDYAGDAAYMGRFLDAAGGKLFVDDANTAIDVEKARAAGIFTKEVAYRLNDGMKVAGARTLASRTTEPTWNIDGGALNLVKFAPSGTDGVVNRFAIGFRITDEGVFEMTRLTDDYAWSDANATYEAVPERRVSQVLASYL